MRRSHLIVLALAALSACGPRATEVAVDPAADRPAAPVADSLRTDDATNPSALIERLHHQRDEILEELRPRLERAPETADSLAVMTLARLASVLALYDPDPAEREPVLTMIEGFWPEAAPETVDERLEVLSLLIDAHLRDGDVAAADAYAEEMLVWFESPGFARHRAETTHSLAIEPLARAHRDAGRPERAEELYRRAVASGPAIATVGCFEGLLALLEEQQRHRELRAICASELEMETTSGMWNPRADVAREFMERVRGQRR